MRSRHVLLFGLILLLLGAAAFAGIALGSVSVPLPDVVTTLTGGQPSKAAYTTIVLQFRLPRVLTALLAGAGLAVGGLQMQTLFRNPLADPFVLGVSSGASLGVALVVLAVGTPGAVLLAGLGLIGDLGLALAASLGAALALLVVLLTASRVGGVAALLVVGLMFGYLLSALVSLLLYFSIAERIQAYINWTFGSFGGVTWRQMAIFAPVVLIGLGVAHTLPKALNGLLLGETYAQSMGVNVPRARLLIVVSTSLLAGAVTAFCGPIGFLGVAVPHLCRTLFRTSDHRVVMPAAALVGALVAVIADLAAQAPGGQTILPLNAVMAALGAPVVIWIILRGRNQWTSQAT